LFSLIEHSRPLYIFRREATRLAKGQADQLAPSKFRGIYRKIASDLNDGIDQVAAKGGVPRRAADLKQVLGDLPAEPQMSASASLAMVRRRRSPSPSSRPQPSIPRPPPRPGAPRPPHRVPL